jgi:hypothetical protein
LAAACDRCADAASRARAQDKPANARRIMK